MISDKMREEFEAWQADSYSGPFTDPFWLVRDSKDPERYALFEIQSSWRAWQASRAAVVVELPVRTNARPAEEVSWHSIRNQTIDACARSVQAAGLKVKS